MTIIQSRIADPVMAIAAHAASVADGNSCILPTHVWTANGEVIGWASVGQIALLAGWAHSKRASDEEAAAGLKLIEAEAWRTGAKAIAMPCTPDCRFIKLLDQKAGWQLAKESVALYVNFRKPKGQ